MPEGRKDDQTKLRYELIPPEIDAAMAAVLTYGAVKYEPRNWELGMSWSRPYAALKRHMDAFWGGEDHDPETGMPHLWHAACCMAFLVAYQQRGLGHDDRWLDPDLSRDDFNIGFFETVARTAIDGLTGELPVADPRQGDDMTATWLGDGEVETPTPTPIEGRGVGKGSARPAFPKPNFGPGAGGGDDDLLE